MSRVAAACLFSGHRYAAFVVGKRITEQQRGRCYAAKEMLQNKMLFPLNSNKADLHKSIYTVL